MNRKILLIIAVLASAALSAHAGLQFNGGFETGDYTGWVLSGDTSFTSVTTNMPHSGNFSSQMGPVNSDGFLDQVIPTLAGQCYMVTFWLKNTALGANDFSASFAGLNILALTNAPAFGYTEYTANITATSTSSDLHFAFYNGPSFWFLDDVDVQPCPEPGTLGLIGLGGLGLVGAARKRRRFREREKS
jgi:PEP-CTERM motif